MADEPTSEAAGRQIADTILAGCVDYIAGSHKWGSWFAPQFFKSGNPELKTQDPRFELIPDFEAQRDDLNLLSWDLEPGD